MDNLEDLVVLGYTVPGISGTVQDVNDVTMGDWELANALNDMYEENG
jgi:hypothetical protein